MTAVVTIALAADGRGWVDGTEVHGDTLDATRAAALAHVTTMANRRRRPVRVAATDPDGSVWQFAVGPDGVILDPDQARQLMADPDALTVPAAYRQRIEAIVAAVDGDQEHIAMNLARRLEESAAAEHGSAHPFVWRARELRAHATYACGLPGAACELYLEVARGWHDMDSPAYWGAAQRAYALWHATTDERGRMVWLGEQLVDVLRVALPDHRASTALAEVLRRVDDINGAPLG